MFIALNMYIVCSFLLCFNGLLRFVVSAPSTTTTTTKATTTQPTTTTMRVGLYSFDLSLCVANLHIFTILIRLVIARPHAKLCIAQCGIGT